MIQLPEFTLWIARAVGGLLRSEIVERIRAGAVYYATAVNHRAVDYPASPANTLRDLAETIVSALSPFPAIRWAALVVATLTAVFAARLALKLSSPTPGTLGR